MKSKTDPDARKCFTVASGDTVNCKRARRDHNGIAAGVIVQVSIASMYVVNEDAL